jgi:hypothetical protein
MSDNEADREISISAGIPFVGVAAYFGVDGGIKDTIYLEATAEYGIDITEELSAGISASAAYLIDDNDGGESGFANYTAGVSLGYGIFGASVTYIGQGDDKVLPEEQGGYDVEVVGMLSIGYTF